MATYPRLKIGGQGSTRRGEYARSHRNNRHRLVQRAVRKGSTLFALHTHPSRRRSSVLIAGTLSEPGVTRDPPSFLSEPL